MKLKISSDGTRVGTRVMTEDGSVITGITAVHWSINVVDGRAAAKIVVREVPVELRGDAVMIGKENC